MLTCPKALWTGEGGGAWPPVHLSLENSWLPSCCCSSASGLTFFGSLWCVELPFFVDLGPSVCSLSKVYLKQIYIKHSYLNFVHSVHVSILHLVDSVCFLMDIAAFFSFFCDSFVWAFSFLLPSDLLGRIDHSFAMAPDEACVDSDICSRMGWSLKTSVGLPGTWIFLLTTLVWNSSNLCEIFCCAPGWDNWRGQGKTSQSKCMWAGTWATVWGWETQEPDATEAGERGGPEAGGYDLWASLASGWGAMTCGWVSFPENSGGRVLCRK